MDEKVLDEKTAAALKAVREAVSEPSGTFALYLGDMASRVLLHLLKEAGGGRVPVGVISLMDPAMPGGLCRFAGKLRRMYSLDMAYVRLRDKAGGSRYTPEELRAEAYRALEKAGAVRAVSPCPAPSGDVPDGPGAGGVRVCRPLAGFSEEDLRDYIRERGLPLCTLDLKGGGTPGIPDGGGVEGDRELKEKLKSLGYM